MTVQACLPAVVGFGLTLLLMRGGGLAVLAAIGATVAVQGALLIGEFAPPLAPRRLSYADRARAGLFVLIPFGATALVATLILIYGGLAFRTEAPSPSFFVTPALVLLAMLGSSILLSPAIVLDVEPGRAFERALRTVWRPVVALVLALLYIAALVGAVWLGPDQLLSLGLVGQSDLALVRAIAGWVAVAVLSIPFWSITTRLYVAPASG